MMAAPPEDSAVLRSVFLHVTRACHQRCGYCYFSAGFPMPNEMTAREYEALWPQLVSLRPRKVVFTGGEPLLRSDIFALLRGLRDADRDHRVLRCLNTNGWLVSPGLAGQLVGLADEVSVSVDALALANDALRGEGSFDAAMQALECLYAVGFEPKVLITVTAVSLPDLEGLLALLFARNLTCIHLNPLRLVGRARGCQEWLVPAEAVQSRFQRVWHRCYPGRPWRAPGQDRDCCAGSYLNILPNGDVFPCHVLSGDAFRCGNVRDTGLHQIWGHIRRLGRLNAIGFQEQCRNSLGEAPRNALVDPTTA